MCRRDLVYTYKPSKFLPASALHNILRRRLIQMELSHPGDKTHYEKKMPIFSCIPVGVKFNSIC